MIVEVWNDRADTKKLIYLNDDDIPELVLGRYVPKIDNSWTATTYECDESYNVYSAYIGINNVST